MLTLHESAERIGGYIRVERALVDVMGRWLPTIPEPDARVLVGRQVHHHAWHADTWERLLPDVPGVAVPACAALVDAVATSDDTIGRLVGVYRVVLPRKIAAYSAHLAATETVSDGPVIRALKQVLADEIEDWREGEAAVQALLTDDDAVRRAADHLARVEAVVVRGLL